MATEIQDEKVEYETLNAEIVEAYIGINNHGDLEVQIALSMVGGLGTTIGMAGKDAGYWIERILGVVCKGDWSQVKGSFCRVRKIKGGHVGAKAVSIIHIVKDDIRFSFDEPAQSDEDS